MKSAAIATTLLAAGLALSACKGSSSRHTLLQNKGSDTLVNVAQAWAETYRTVRPEVAVAVSGGGSGTGIAALINGTVDLANASREITPSEAAEIRKARRADPVQHVVARDAIVIYLHKRTSLIVDSPLWKLFQSRLRHAQELRVVTRSHRLMAK